uniref:Retrotransposon protein, putative, unclassified n=1 Tax=Oryza sativa subsp. japonica TaxID=39947 RepID=Q2QX60_ORYSJ|nr:retrotransposon protein, putative, unclassified [Oryza sativa Japonica Group]
MPGDLSEKIVEEAQRRFVSGLEFTTFGVKEELPRVIEAWVVLSGACDGFRVLSGEVGLASTRIRKPRHI